MLLFNWIHTLLNYVLLNLRLIANRQVGWKSINRKTGILEREQEPLLIKLKLLILFHPFISWINSTHLMRLLLHLQTVSIGRINNRPSSHNQIKALINLHNIDMEIFEPSDPEEYTTFNDFFVRKMKPGSRPIHAEHDATKAITVADCRVVTYETVPLAKKLWIKGSEFSITNLVMDVDLGARFEDGSVASFRLSPKDYHHYHSPVSGTIKEFRRLPGTYYQIDPVALQSSVDILTGNVRDYVVIETLEFGDVLFVAIGATGVGSIEIQTKFQIPGTKVEKGDELGLFQFGGSSIIVAFQKDRVKFDQDLLDCSGASLMVSVEVGMSLGEATKPAKSSQLGNGHVMKLIDDQQAAVQDSEHALQAVVQDIEHALGTGYNEKSFAQVVQDGQSDSEESRSTSGGE